MKRLNLYWVIVFLSVAGITPALAGSHFTTGIAGSGPAWIPPPGFYYKMYNCFYSADTYKVGSKTLGGDDSVTNFIQVHRALWNSGHKFLGADVIGQLVMPLIYVDVGRDLVGPDGRDNRFSVGDLQTEFIMQWYPHEQVTWLIGLSVFWPIGDYKKNSAVSTGTGNFGFMAATGGQIAFDREKTWNFGVVAKYEKSTKEFSTDKRPGDYVHFETSLQKRWGKWSAAGLFCGTWQVTDGRGFENHERKLSAGPEIGYFATDSIELQVKALWEFKNRNASQGTQVHFTFMKAF